MPIAVAVALVQRGGAGSGPAVGFRVSIRVGIRVGAEQQRQRRARLKAERSSAHAPHPTEVHREARQPTNDERLLPHGFAAPVARDDAAPAHFRIGIRIRTRTTRTPAVGSQCRVTPNRQALFRL